MNFMRRLAAALLFPAALSVSSLAWAQENPQAPKQTIRVSVDRVNVGVIVTDHSGHFVEGLRREDFRVFDNGVEQPLAGFAPIEEPGQVLLLIEAGPAVYLLESGHVWAADSLLGGLSGDDRVAVVKYADLPTALLDFTADKQAALTTLAQLRFNLGFGSLNLSSSVSRVLEWLARVQGKKTIVLLSTGIDTSPSNEATLLMPQLKVSEVRLLAVSLAGGLQNPQPGSKKKSPTKESSQTAQQFEQADELLKRMAESTGGRAYFPANAQEFNSVYFEIAQLVRHEYSLAFAAPVLDGVVHAIEVRVNAPQTPMSNKQAAGYRVDHRQAYIASAPSTFSLSGQTKPRLDMNR
jgi:Ca-activated chloride channel family protein